MSEHERDPTNVDWDDPEECPFCGAALRDGGAGFIEHVEANETCRRRFEEWRENVDDDVAPEWTG